MALKSNSLHEWLQQMQLGHYERTLQHNGYDTLEKCTFLNEQILQQIGILLPGHQKRILANLPSGDYCYAKSIPFNFDDDIPPFPAPEPPVGSPPPVLPPKNHRRKQEQMLGEPCVVKTSIIPEKPIPERPIPRPRVTVMKKSDESDRPVPMPRSRIPATSDAESASGTSRPSQMAPSTETAAIKVINPIHNLNATPDPVPNDSLASDAVNHYQIDPTSNCGSEPVARRTSSGKDTERGHQRSTSTLLCFDPYFVKSPDKIISTPSSTKIAIVLNNDRTKSSQDDIGPEVPEKMFTFDVSNMHDPHRPESSKNIPSNTSLAHQSATYEPLWVLKSLQNQESGREAAVPFSTFGSTSSFSSQTDPLYKRIQKTDNPLFDADPPSYSEPPSYPPPQLPSEKAPPIPPRPMDKGKSSSMKSLDPFNGQDPFKDFGPVCDIFNKGSASGLDEVEFDPFFQHGCTVPSQQAFYPETLNSVPPPQHPPSTGLQKPFSNNDGESSEGSASSLPCSPASISSSGAKITPGIQSPRTLEKSGYLHKQGGAQSNKGWRKRWVIFNGRDLRYYSNEKSQVSKRIVPLSSMMEVDQDIKETEKNQFKFVLKTKNRNFLFATETLEENILWCSTLKQAILLFKPTHDDVMDGGFMNNPDIAGHVKFESIGRFYVAVKNSILCYYRRQDDFAIGSPINELDMKLASVKELSKTKLQLYTNYFQVCLIFENVSETQLWKEALKNATEIGLSTQHGFCESPAAKVKENPSNKNCADCDAQDPNWASLDLGILICRKCSGIHRESYQVKSLLLDYKVWTPSLIEMMQQIGNENANNFWEYRMNPALQIDKNVSDVERKVFIENKYKKKLFINAHHLQNQQKLLNEALLEAVQTDDILKTMRILFSGADINYTSPERPTETALQLAKKTSQRLQMEFLIQNQADKTAHLSGGDNNCDELVQAKRNSVHHQGYLFKTGVNMKASDFLRRWCLLERCCLSYYADKKNTVAKGSIENTTMLVIQATVMDKYPFSFELSTTQNNYRIYQFAAESLPEQTSWMQALAKVFCPPQIMNSMAENDFDLAGYFYFKWHGMEWSRIWLRIYGKELRIFTKDKEREIYDLRKTINVNVINSEHCQSTIQNGYPFIAGFPGRSLYFQADLQHDTERLEKAIRAATTKCQNTLEDQQLTSDNVPVIVDKCIKFIMTNGLSEDGIYRRNGVQSRVTALLETFEKDAQEVHLLLKNFSLHDVSSALRKFFRTLKDPLLTRKFYDKWLDAATKEDTQIKLKLYKYLVESMPSINRNTLKKMVVHLWSISQHEHENKMGIDQLAIVFGPTLMAIESGQNGQYTYHRTNTEITVVREIIRYHEYLFEVKPEKEIEDKIQKAIRELEIKKSMNQTKEDLNSLNLHIHVGVYNSDPIMINGSFQMTAEDLLKSVEQKINLKDVNWLLFEVVCEGMLERPVHNFEVIGDVIGQWQNWDDADARTAVLLVRQAHLSTQLKDHYDPGRSLMAELEFSDKKGIKKYLFEFSQARLSYYKDTKGTNLVSSWRVEDLIIYMGVEAGRNSKDRSGFTIVVKNEKTKRTKDTPHFGHALYFPNDGMMFSWYAGMMFTKYSSTS